MKKVALTLLLILNTACSSLLYHPTDHMFVKAESLENKPQDIYFKSKENNKKLHAWYFSTKKPKGLIVFFHGNAQNLSSHFLHLYWVLKFNYDFMIFDYQGYGKSEGSPSPKGTVQDGLAALEWGYEKSKEKGNLPLFVFGQSLGGAVSLRSIYEFQKVYPENKFKGIIIDSSFLSYQQAAKTVMNRSWLLWSFQWMNGLLFSDEWAPVGVVDKINGAKLVFHGDQDQVIEYKLGQDLFSKISKPKTFYKIPNGHHGSVFRVQDGHFAKIFYDWLESERIK